MEPRFDQRLLHFLRRSGLKRSELARKVGVKPQAVTAWLSRHGSTPEYANLVKAIKAMGIDLQTFFGPLEDKPKTPKAAAG